MKAIQIEKFGGPEEMELVDLPDPEAGDGESLVEVARCGVNFADTHTTRNDYLAEQSLPLIPGAEIAGTVDGRRVAALIANGGYAEKVAVPDGHLVPIPDELGDEAAAALLLQGITAHALVHRCARLAEGETVVIEAAAGGTGGLAVQIAKRAGARVIGLASSEDKRAHAERLGADATVDSRAEDLATAILEANDGNQTDAVFEMTGGEAFKACLSTLAPFGRLVAFGMASREQVQVSNAALMATSRSVIGFWMAHLLGRPAELVATIGELLGWAAAGELEVTIGGTYPLSEAHRAHEDLIGRKTTGKILLDPSA